MTKYKNIYNFSASTNIKLFAITIFRTIPMKNFNAKNVGLTKKTTLNSIKRFDSLAQDEELFNENPPIYSYHENRQKLNFNSVFYSSQSQYSNLQGKQTPQGSSIKTVRKNNFYSPCTKRNRLSQKSEKQNQKYYLYWKNKANEYQLQNFTLLKQNSHLKRTIQQIKHCEIKLQLSNKKLQKELQKLVEVQKVNQQFRKDQQIIYARMKQLENSLNESNKLVEHLEKTANLKIQNLNSINQGILKQLRQKIRQLQAQNSQYKLIKKQQQGLKTMSKLNPIFNDTNSFTSLTTIQISDKPWKQKINRNKLL